MDMPRICQAHRDTHPNSRLTLILQLLVRGAEVSEVARTARRGVGGPRSRLTVELPPNEYDSIAVVEGGRRILWAFALQAEVRHTVQVGATPRYFDVHASGRTTLGGLTQFLTQFALWPSHWPAVR